MLGQTSQLQFKINRKNEVEVKYFNSNENKELLVRPYTYLNKLDLLKNIEMSLNIRSDTKSIQDRLDYLEDQFKNIIAFTELTKKS